MKSLVFAAATAVLSMAAWAFPDKPITILVPFAAGGPTDKVARDIAEVMRKGLNNQSIVIENVVGAGGTLGAMRLTKAAPDGYTLLMHHVGMATAPALYSKLAYKPLEDFEYLGVVNEVPMVVVGRANLPANNYAELRKWIDGNKGNIKLANAGIGAASHLCGLLFQQGVGVDMNPIPFNGTGPAMTNLLGGHVDIMCDQVNNTIGQIEAGKIKAFAVSTSKRLPSATMAKVPTLDESGLKGFNVTVWNAMYAPKGTPKAVLDQINTAMRNAMKDPEFVKRQEAQGAVVVTDARMNPAEHKKFVEAEIAKWGPAIKAAGQFAD